MSAEKFEESPIIFGDYLKMGASQSDRIYEELVDMKKVANILSEVCLLMSFAHQHVCTMLILQYLDDFNMNSPKEMKLVFFLDAIEHVSRYVQWVSGYCSTVGVPHDLHPVQKVLLDSNSGAKLSYVSIGLLGWCDSHVAMLSWWALGELESKV